MHRSVWLTNVAVVVFVAVLCWAFGWQTVLFVELPLVILAGGVGIWLFYVQHQFETTYWDTHRRVGFQRRGAARQLAPRAAEVLQFFSGNIGFHHVHHLNAKIPNYNLQRAHEEQARFRSVPSMSLADGLRVTRLKLWDEQSQQMVTWKQARARCLNVAFPIDQAPGLARGSHG